ncbi:hypothetical protein [uncultured Martelella sp.]|uniref:hypothetical protein n=1 Tax=uncultured Martelella sp. TaxID=392331 RepID=UPI0029C7FAF6|nr:hypothetical protein [uncultured Martelella sp.]
MDSAYFDVMTEKLFKTWKRTDYDVIVKPILTQIFGTSDSNDAPIIGLGAGPVEDFLLPEGGKLLKSLDVRKSVRIKTSSQVDPSKPVLLYLLDDLVIAPGARIYTDLNITIRARSVIGDLLVTASAGVDGASGKSFRDQPAAANGANGARQTGHGSDGRDASDWPGGSSAGNGGDGPRGNDGGDGRHGEGGGDGSDGSNANNVTVWVERFEDGSVEIEAIGGAGGEAGWGQDGGHGGDGSRGGQGGRGGGSTLFGGAGDGGRGGTGGNGGKGGNGGSPGKTGRPGDGGFIRFWVPFHENTKPPSGIKLDFSAGHNPAPARPGRPGSGGAAGKGGRGGQGGTPTPVVHGWGKSGAGGVAGTPGADGSSYPFWPMQEDGKEYPADVSVRKHPSAEVEVLMEFID